MAQEPAPILVGTDWLADHLDDPALRIFDCTVISGPHTPERMHRASGRPGYEQGHIPGAGFMDLFGDLSDASSPLRFTLPAPEAFARAVERRGVSDDSRVVLYSTREYWWATRLWWMFRVFGFDNAALLDGGWQKWCAEGRPVSTLEPPPPPGRFTPGYRPHLVADRSRVLQALEDPGTCVVNALSPDLHTGRSEVHYGRPGHIAGSVNVYGLHLIERESNVMRQPDELRRAFDAAGVLQAQRVITYCGGGIAATGDAFALALLGNFDVAVYDASMQEWANDPSLPMNEGEQP